MNDSDVYIRAAQLVDTGEWMFSCAAVAHASGEVFGRDGGGSLRVLAYAEVFSFAYGGNRPYNDHKLSRLHDRDPERAKLMRVLMLCLMAVIVEEGNNL